MSKTEVPGSKETRVGVNKGNLGEDLRHRPAARNCMYAPLGLAGAYEINKSKS